MSDLFFYEGLDDRAEVLRERITALLGTDDLTLLRKYYRLLLLLQEK